MTHLPVPFSKYEIYRNWIKLSNTKLNIDESLKLQQLLNYLFFLLFFLVLWLTDITAAGLVFFGAITLRAAAAELDVDLARIVLSPNSQLFHPTSVLKVSTNELTSWIGCVRWGRQCWGAPGQFWKPLHFRDMFFLFFLSIYNITIKTIKKTFYIK